MQKKEIAAVLPRPTNYNMVGDGFRVYNYFPSGYNIRNMVSPFLMLDFNPAHNFGPSLKPKGVDVHPHKGFETVTIAYKGSVAHHDSSGNSGIIFPGDVQWMTAGAGVLHKEFHEENFSKTGGDFEMVQLWVNLPKKFKTEPAHYQAITAEQMGKYFLPNSTGLVNIIAGNFNGIKGAASTYTPMNLWDMKLNVGDKLNFDVSAQHNCFMILIEGEINVNDENAKQHQFVLFKNEGETIEITALEKSVILFLSGEPIDEPVVQYGPFVMNTNQEIHQAIDEFNSGKFGHLE